MGQAHENDRVGSGCTGVQIGETGLEPSRRLTLEPKSSASASSATPLCGVKVISRIRTDECLSHSQMC